MCPRNDMVQEIYMYQIYAIRNLLDNDIIYIPTNA